jgi:type II secretory pathway pseudopilin PulG
MHKKNGFSSIELIIAIAVIVIFSIIAVPKFTDTLRKSNENATKTSLGALRSAIAMYYGDHEGEYPSEKIAQELTENGIYIKEIPAAYCPPYHGKSSAIITKDFEANKDSGHWAYKVEDADDGTGKVKGQIWILCTHTDSKGNVWSEL